MEKQLIDSFDYGEKVTSSYAEIYLNDEYCGYERPASAATAFQKEVEKLKSVPDDESNEIKDEWTSPSDLLIGKVDLYPPFTSKITRGQTHEGILAIGDGVLQKERNKFLAYLKRLIDENEAAWARIEIQEKQEVVHKVKAIYENIFLNKSKIMQKELDVFFEGSLQEVENSVREHMKSALLNAHSHVVSELNIDIHKKLKTEKDILHRVLQKRYEGEIFKLKRYYKLLLDNEIYRNNQLVNNAIWERNDALKAFYNQIEAENFTSVMYIMCTERKKCRIKQFLLENVQTAEIAEKTKRTKQKQQILDAFERMKVPICELNKQWEEKIRKVLKLFLKFISFSLKLLPEQSTFLLDLERLLVLQLNEIQKCPTTKSSILIYEKELWNVFKFETLEEDKLEEPVCDREPFVVEGDTASTIPTPYGSRETLPSHKDLPYVRLGRQFIYAKCQRMEEVRAFLESQRCKCHDKQPGAYPPEPVPSSSSESTRPPSPSAAPSKSSTELFMVDDIERMLECPVRYCQDWAKRHSFPYLDSYLDFSEVNYERVQTLLGKPRPLDPAPPIIKAHDIVYQQLRFAATKEKTRDAETQYSSQEDLTGANFHMPPCPCMDDTSDKIDEALGIPKIIQPVDVENLIMKRRISLQRLIQKNPNLLKMFTDESFDFIL